MGADSLAIPGSFTYFGNLNSVRGRMLARSVGRFVTGPLTFSEDVVRGLAEDRARGDLLSDAVVTAGHERGFVRSIRKMVERALDHGIAAVEEAPQELVDLFEHLDREPDWLDWDRVERGAKVFRRYGTDAFFYFGVITLEGYRVEIVNKVLGLTGAYVGDGAFRRFLETCRFWIDASEPGALRQGGRGRRSAVLVRVMHSMIRRHVAAHAEWDSTRLGVPLSPNPQLVVLTLSFLLNEQMKAIGHLVGDEEILDHMHLWRYIGYLIGVEPVFWPETIEDWWRMAYFTSVMDQPYDGEDSRNLGQSFVNAFAGRPQDSREVRTARNREYRKVLGWSKFFLSGDSYRAHQLPPAGLTRLLPLTLVPRNLAIGLARRAVPRFDDAYDRMQRKRRAQWLHDRSGGEGARFTAVDRLSR